MVRTIVAALTALFLAYALPTLVLAAPPIEAYGKLPAIEHMHVSPSGQRIAFISNAKGARRVVMMTAEGAPIAAADLGPTKANGLVWAGEDHVIVFTSATVSLGVGWEINKHELGAAIVMDANTHKGFGVFMDANQRRVAKTVVGYYGTALINGRQYGYFGGYPYTSGASDIGRQPRQDDEGVVYPDLYRVDLSTGEFDLAAKGTPNTADWLIGADGAVLATLTYKARTGAWKLSGAGGTQLAAGVDPFGDVAIMGQGRSPGTIVLATGEDDEQNSYQEIALANGTHTPLDADIGEMLFDPKSRLWIGSLHDNGADVAMFIPAQQTRLRAAMRAFPDYATRLVSYSADMNRMIVFTHGKDDSGTYWLVDIATRGAKDLAMEYPAVKVADVGLSRWVDYKAADGLALRGVLTMPPGGAEKKNLPLVVMPHGGPWSSDEPGFDYWAQAFASRGYAVFQPNFRGSDTTQALYEAGIGEWGRKMQTDISDGVAELARQGIVDPKRACIVGWSYGGYAALAGVTLQQGLYRCAMSFGGVFDIGDQLIYIRQSGGSTGPGTRIWRTYIGEGIDPSSISPARLAAKADAPVLLMHGQNDTVVKPDQSQSMARALRNANKPVELVLLPGADHWLLQEDARVQMVTSSVAFVMKHNPP
jgi:dipeptidyl aminopeptidase/acylaminoacyl peptidase